MKHVLFFFFYFVLSLVALAQTSLHCGTTEALNDLCRRQPEVRARLQKNNAALQQQLQLRTATVSASYMIPVVIHILHQNGVENISDEQARDALRVMNQDYAKQNADFNQVIQDFQTVADSTRIQFVLATRDPAGNCTTGILHHEDTDTDWNDQSPTLFSYSWDPTRYMNVYVVRSITLANGFQASGYAYYPGTWPDGFAYDGMVMLHNYFGTIGTGDPFLTRVLTHETGHWLSLKHTFGDQSVGSDCFGDDEVNDTPPSAGFASCPNAAQPAGYQLCAAGVSENFQNFMDYSYCSCMFTQGQAQRMQACLQSNIAGRNNLWTNANLVFTGVLSPMGPCAPEADYICSRKRTCTNVPVVFTDNSAGGEPANYSWVFAGGTPATSAASVQAVTYAAPGNYGATLTVSNAAGTSTKVKQAVVKVVANAAAYSGNWAESFSNAATVANDWTMAAKNGVAFWEHVTFAAASGQGCMRINRLSNTRKNTSSMTSPLIDMSGVSNPVLIFKVALAEYYPNHQNNLKVHVSSDCGVNWTEIYSKHTPQLITSASTATNFIPTGPASWRLESVNLSAFAQAGALMFRYEYRRDTLPQTNNIYLDDINIVTSVDVSEPSGHLRSLEVFPVPATNEMTVSFELVENAEVSMRAVDFLGRETELMAPAALTAGSYQQQLRGLDVSTSGVWLLKVRINGRDAVRKVATQH